MFRTESNTVTLRIRLMIVHDSPCSPSHFPRLGPGVSWFDADNDGDPDLLIGSDRGASPVLFTNEGEKFFATVGCNI